MSRGIIPEGVWILDEAHSRKLVPASVTLWIIRDDGERLIWVGVETSYAGEISINTFDGVYGGEPAIVHGCEFSVSLSSPAPRTVRVEGDIPNMGPFSETTVISPDRCRMRVDGQVLVGDQAKQWYEEFEWFGPIPLAQRGDRS